MSRSEREFMKEKRKVEMLGALEIPLAGNWRSGEMPRLDRKDRAWDQLTEKAVFTAAGFARLCMFEKGETSEVVLYIFRAVFSISPV